MWHVEWFMQVHLCFPVVAAVPLQLRRSPGIFLLLALLLCSWTGCLGLPSVVLSPRPPTPYQPVHCDECGKQRARSGANKCVCQPTCLPGSNGSTPPPACSDYGSERRRNQRRTPRRCPGKRWHRGVWSRWHLQVYFIKAYFGGSISPLCMRKYLVRERDRSAHFVIRHPKGLWVSDELWDMQSFSWARDVKSSIRWNQFLGRGNI